jgi:hypothetical protein
VKKTTGMICRVVANSLRDGAEVVDIGKTTLENGRKA